MTRPRCRAVVSGPSRVPVGSCGARGPGWLCTLDPAGAHPAHSDGAVVAGAASLHPVRLQLWSWYCRKVVPVGAAAERPGARRPGSAAHEAGGCGGRAAYGYWSLRGRWVLGIGPGWPACTRCKGEDRGWNRGTAGSPRWAGRCGLWVDVVGGQPVGPSREGQVG